MGKVEQSLVDYFDALNYHLYALMARTNVGPKKEKQQDKKLSKIESLLIVCIIGMSQCFYSLGQIRWGTESLKLLETIGGGLLDKDSEMRIYIKDMIGFYEEHFSDQVAIAAEFEHILLDFLPKTSQIGQRFYDLAMVKVTEAEENKELLLDRLDYLVDEYRLKPLELELMIKQWFVQQNMEKQQFRNQSSKTNVKEDKQLDPYLLVNPTSEDLKSHLKSGSTFASYDLVPKSTENSVGLRSKFSMSSKSRGKSQQNIDSVKRPRSTLRPKSMISTISKTESIISATNKSSERKNSYALDSLLAPLTKTVQLNEAKRQLGEIENFEKPTAEPTRIVDETETTPIGKCFEDRILTGLRRDFRLNQSLDGIQQKMSWEGIEEGNYNLRFKRTKRVCKARRFYGETVSLQRKEEESNTNDWPDPNEVMHEIIYKRAKEYYTKGKIKSRSSKSDSKEPRISLYQNLIKNHTPEAKLDAVIRKHPELFKMPKFLILKETIHNDRTLLREEKVKSEIMVNKEKSKSAAERKRDADRVVLSNREYWYGNRKSIQSTDRDRR